MTIFACPEVDLFPRSISVIGERKESLKPENSPPSVEGNKKKFKWNIKVGECENTSK